uniref:G-protein coupled receptors family 1 profile domain-containing protein n=1 Tax=Salvator merianae TaxID=96440 RepID=A0A8D0DPK3_SALMN
MMTEYESTTPFDYDSLVTPVYDHNVQIFTSHFVPVLYSLVFIFGLLGNALVVLVLIRYKKLKSMTDIYLLNLALSDLLFIFSLPFWAYSAADEWIFGKAMCKIFAGIYQAGFFSGSFFIILLTIDRYLAIVHPVFAQKARTVVYGILTSLIAWFVALSASVPELLFLQVEKQHEKCTCLLHYPIATAKVWKQFLNSMMFLLGIVIPWVILVFCYVQIIKILMRDMNRRKMKAIRLIFVIMILFSLLWMPYNIAVLLNTFDGLCNQDGGCSNKLLLAVNVTQVIAMSHCCINPVIYAFVGEKFRRHLCILWQKYMACYLCKICPGRYHPNLERSTSYSMTTSQHDVSTGL